MARNLIGRLSSATAINNLDLAEASAHISTSREVGNSVLLEGTTAAEAATLPVERIWENVHFDLNVFQPGPAGEVANDDNWGVTNEGLQVERLWGKGSRGAGVRVGIADTGLDLSHPTFQTLCDESRFVAFAHFDVDGHKISQFDGSGHEMNDEEAVPTFSDYHGTHCAAILAGAPTAGKLRGFVPEAELVAARVESSYASFKASFAWLLNQKCDVVSLSLGIPGKREVWADEIRALLDQGTIVVAASGNEFIYENKTRSPANYPLPGLVSVGAMKKDCSVWFQSGGEVVDWPQMVYNTYGILIPSIFADASPFIVPTLVAPGVDIVSAAPAGEYYLSTGSSMATPHVAGIIALALSLMRTKHSDATAQAAAQTVLNSVIDQPPAGPDIRSGRGIIYIEKLSHDLDSFLDAG